MLVETVNAEDAWQDVYKAPELEGASPLLITWGVAAGADLMCWDASGEEPAEWPVLVFNRGEIHRFLSHTARTTRSIVCPQNGREATWNRVSPISATSSRKQRTI